MIKELTTYIDNNSSVLTLGTNLFAGDIPSAKEGKSTVVEKLSPGIRNPTPYQTDMGQTPFRIKTRGAVGDSWFTTESIALIVFNILHGKMQVSLPVVNGGPTYIVNISCNDPYYMGKDEKNRHIFITNTLIYREEL
jgi:hypothetical protein